MPRCGGPAAGSCVGPALGSCAQTNKPTSADSTAAEVAANGGMNATYCTQNAVEFKANSYALYTLAKLRLDQALADENWTALPGEQGTGYQDKPPAVILDIDETVLDNSDYQAWTVTAGSASRSKPGTPFVAALTGRELNGATGCTVYARAEGGGGLHA